MVWRRQIVQPLQRLETQAAAVASGDYESIQERSGHLRSAAPAGELAAMARKVKSLTGRAA